MESSSHLHAPSNSLGHCEDCLFQELSESPFYATPSEDIWKKFELPMTPPHSPSHDHYYDSDYLVDSQTDDFNFGTLRMFEPVNQENALRRDCMWSQGNSVEELTKSQRLGTQKAQSIDSVPCVNKSVTIVTPLSTHYEPDYTSTISMLQAVDKVDRLEYKPTECVNPIHVFPYPVNTDHSYSCKSHGGGSNVSPKQKVTVPSGMQTPSDSEEEIDVVTVEQRQQQEQQRQQQQQQQQQQKTPAKSKATANKSAAVTSRLKALPRAVLRQQQAAHASRLKEQLLQVAQAQAALVLSNTRVATRAASLPMVPRQSTRTQGHGGGTTKSSPQKRSSPSTPTKPAPIAKRPRVESAAASPGYDGSSPSSGSSRPSSRSGSDSEEGLDGKKVNHNDLERKRRNELKSSFMRLRDNVPELQTQDRTPKVTILRKGAQYISELDRLCKSLEAEKQKCLAYQQELKKKLDSLKKRPRGCSR